MIECSYLEAMEYASTGKKVQPVDELNWYIQGHEIADGTIVLFPYDFKGHFKEVFYLTKEQIKGRWCVYGVTDAKTKRVRTCIQRAQDSLSKLIKDSEYEEQSFAFIVASNAISELKALLNEAV